jgi:hypothetical protein
VLSQWLMRKLVVSPVNIIRETRRCGAGRRGGVQGYGAGEGVPGRHDTGVFGD